MVDMLLWIVAAFGAVMAVSHLVDADRLAPWHALTPWVMAPSGPVGLFALATGRWLLAGLSLVVTATLTVLARPLFGRRAGEADGPRLSVLYANLKFDQPTPDLAARALLDVVTVRRVDVLAVGEATIAFAEALEAFGVAHELPHRVGNPVTGPEASVLWSRYAVREVGDAGPGPTWDADAVIEVDGAPVRIIATHPLPPVGADMRPHWRPGLASTARRARRSSVPVLVVGDLNAARWHRVWRRFVGGEFVSAHEATGRGWTTSWPADRWFPPFVRLDHALCGRGLVPLAVEEVPVPGSDHRGFVVSIAISERSARPR